jgi:two-component system C4-dicarboxylate transport sensor histidine kinase DctB
MEQRVKERTAELSRYRDHLEELVEERTAELKTANVHLQREINERMQAEQARRQAVTELEEQRTLSMRSDRLRSLGEMAAGIAHELNQPLMSVRGLAEHSSDSVHNR